VGMLERLFRRAWCWWSKHKVAGKANKGPRLGSFTVNPAREACPFTMRFVLININRRETNTPNGKLHENVQ
jgi:hypothetical protein